VVKDKPYIQAVSPLKSIKQLLPFVSRQPHNRHHKSGRVFAMHESDDRNTSFIQAALEHIDGLYGFAMTLTRDQTEAEDLVQDTYLRAMRAFGRLMPDSNLKSWLFAIMRNAWLNQLRHTRSGPQFVELDAEEENRTQWLDHMANDPHAVYVRKLERDEVRAAIDSLPHLYREIIVLRDIEGFSYQQISSILGCPAGTVMSRLGRAREKLRRLLAEWQATTTTRTIRANEV
jgi:RNA polymerase sigma-70 factor, ECF subfamily